jgi:phosphatidylserine decarboxylase
MRIPLTKYGLPQVIILPVVLITVMAGIAKIGPLFLPAKFVTLTEAVLAIVLIWLLSFFRDPYRPSPPDEKILLAPADGKITDITGVDENEFINGSALKIGIFLSIFDVHINRAPCNVKVEKITYKKGRHSNAMNPSSGRINASNDLWLTRVDEPADKIIVRQISGAIAQRIVCDTKEGQKLSGGERFGMIKFGSRTELYLPVKNGLKTLVKVGDKVKAGITALARYE